MQLIGDIGGTHLRLALAEDGRYHHLQTLRLADYPNLQTALWAYIASTGESVDAAVLAVAAPCSGDRVVFTNADWSFSIVRLQREMGLRELRVLNDLVAQALALPILCQGVLHPVGPIRTPSARRPKVVLGPGTGLGVAALVPAGDAWVPLATEGGHVSLAGANAREDALIRLIRQRFGHCSAERLLCGPGLLRLYRGLARLDDREAVLDTPEAVSAAGTDLATEARAVFFALLGSVAGDLALSYGAQGGVYLTGTILYHMADALSKSTLRERFTAKGRYAPYLDAIPTWRVTAQHPALMGLCRAVDDGPFQGGNARPPG